MQAPPSSWSLLHNVADFSEVCFFFVQGWLVGQGPQSWDGECLVTMVVGQLLADTAQRLSSYLLSYITGVVLRLSGLSRRLRVSWSGHAGYNP